MDNEKKKRMNDEKRKKENLFFHRQLQNNNLIERINDFIRGHANRESHRNSFFVVVGGKKFPLLQLFTKRWIYLVQKMTYCNFFRYPHLLNAPAMLQESARCRYMNQPMSRVRDHETKISGSSFFEKDFSKAHDRRRNYFGCV